MLNYPIIISGGLMLLGFLAHTLVGYREALSTRPHSVPADSGRDLAVIERHWVQNLCAFQLVTIDLLFLTGLLLVLGTTDLLPARREIALITAGFLTLWGTACIVQLLVLRRPFKDYLLLGQWALCFICAGLLAWGAQSL